jgi:uncharacterized protein YjiS (DUF1127 family)
MTIMALDDTGREKAAWHLDFNGFGGLWRRFVTWSAHRRAMWQLSGIEPRLLRDMGIEPATAYGEIPGAAELHASLLSGPAMRRRLRQ